MKHNIMEFFWQTAERYPDRTAIISKKREVTFQELKKEALIINREIRSKLPSVQKTPIAVYLPKCAECIISDLGIIISGNAYMNLDVKTPAMRISSIIDLIKPSAIITDEANYKIISQFVNRDRVIFVDTVDFDQDISMECVHNEHLIDTDPLCIINTSGSTGTPKGVILNHRSFIDFMDWSFETMPFTDYEIIGCLSPVIFDIYSYELCLLIARGATMVLIPEMYAAFPVRILELLNKHHVSFIFWVPTIMVNIANKGLLNEVKLPSLHLVWFAGEVFPTKQCNIWRRALPQAQFVNMYGPIEITLDCTYYIMNEPLSDDQPIPIGRACKNTDILILNEEDQLAKIGEEGELCVRGTSLAMGYYNNPEKTAAAFVQNPLNHSYPEIIYRTGDIACVNEDGNILFRGRKDTLVKHSGYRIELTEIEHIVVNTLALVKNGCIVYDYAKKEIVLFYENPVELTAADFRRKIGTALPKYMVPTVYRYFEELPRNPNGKIDRLYLKENCL